MSDVKVSKINQPTRSKVFLAVIIGPNMSGKTTFSKMAVDFFAQHFPDVDVDHLFYDTYCFNEIIYHLKNYAIASISDFQKCKRRKLILVDAKSMHDPQYRLNIFQFCYMFDIIFLQIYLHFDANEIIDRCAHNGLFITTKMLKDLKFYNTSSFIMHGEPEFKRLYNFLFNCIAPPKNHFRNNITVKVPLEYNNPHKLQMQAGISYKDKLLHGKRNLGDERKKEETSCH